MQIDVCKSFHSLRHLLIMAASMGRFGILILYNRFYNNPCMGPVTTCLISLKCPA